MDLYLKFSACGRHRIGKEKAVRLSETLRAEVVPPVPVDNSHMGSPFHEIKVLGAAWPSHTWPRGLPPQLWTGLLRLSSMNKREPIFP